MKRLHQRRVVTMTRRRRNPIPGICRIDQPEKHNHGFSVRLQRNHKIYSGFFADFSYGGKKRAFAAAQDYLRLLRQKLGPIDRTVLTCRMRGYGAPGMTGVRKITVRRGNGSFTFWQACWSPEPYVVRRQVFAVKKHGARKARQLAIRARRAGVRKMI